jgi:hypothetical protein
MVDDLVMVAVSADDYAWFTEQCADLADAFGVVLVRGRTPAEVVAASGDPKPARAVGLHRLTSLPGPVVAATELDGWTLLLTPRSVPADRRLSRGTVLVAHAGDRFLWARDGEVLLEFDPADASRRSGSDPDGLLEILDRLGFDTAGGDGAGPGDDGGWGDEVRHRERSLALAEQLTGVRITLEALEAATFTCGTLPDQPDAGRFSVAEPPRVSARPAAKPERWDEEYDAPTEDDELSDEDEAEGDGDDREWPRLMARVRRVFS